MKRVSFFYFSTIILCNHCLFGVESNYLLISVEEGCKLLLLIK